MATISNSPARSRESSATPVHNIKQTVSLTEVVMKNKRRSITHGIDTHDAAGGHFQLFFAVANENDGLAKSNAVAFHRHCAARERSDWRQCISSPLRGCLLAAAKRYHRCDKQDRQNAFCHCSSTGERSRGDLSKSDSDVEAAMAVGGMSEGVQQRRLERALATSAIHPGADIPLRRISDATGQQPTLGRSSRVGVTQISWSPILIDASADRHFDRDMAW
jgi:hypothetical protein